MDFKFMFEKFILKQHQPIEGEIKKLLLKQKGNLFVDIGANHGIYSKLLINNFDRIISFEPNPQPDFFPTYNIALSDHNSDSEQFYINTGTGSADTLLKQFNYNPNSSLGTIEQKTYSTDKTINIKVRRYDSMIKDTADLVKIDVEGAELQVLRGMKNKVPTSIMIEIHNTEDIPQLKEIITSYGLGMKKIDEHPRYWCH